VTFRILNIGVERISRARTPVVWFSGGNPAAQSTSIHAWRFD